jgi:predicted DNA-binding transcriptional regulator AlpA
MEKDVDHSLRDFRVSFGHMGPSALITAWEFAELLSITPNALYQLKSKGRLPSPSIQRRGFLRWSAGDVQAWLAAVRAGHTELNADDVHLRTAGRRPSGRPRLPTDVRR